MGELVHIGRYTARPAENDADLAATLALRAARFRAARGRTGEGRAGQDRDSFDAVCDHMLVEEAASGRLVSSFRMLRMSSGTDIGRSYSAQFYDLAPLGDYADPILEMGRFCVHPNVRDPDIVRVAWAAMTALVEKHGVGLLIGCSSFPGTRWQDHVDAFALLYGRHQAPKRWLPRVKVPHVVRFGDVVPARPDMRAAVSGLPPLLRAYLVMGGWVSDHAVIDRDLGTLHVFTGLEVGAVPPARAERLRRLAAAQATAGSLV